MDKDKSAFHVSFNTKNIIALTVVSWAAFAVLSAIAGQKIFNGLNLFQADNGYSFLHYIQDISLYTCGTFIVFILPGLLWVYPSIKNTISCSKLLLYSFLVSIFFLFFITTLYKVVSPVGLNGSNFMTIVIGISLLGLLWLVLVKRSKLLTVSMSKSHLMIGVSLIVLTIMSCWIFQEKVLWVNFDNNFSSEHVLSFPLGEQDDLMEHFGLVDSLKQHLMPFWDLEYADRFGYSVIDPPLHAFVSLFLILIFGQSFAVQSLNTIMVIMASYLLIIKMAELGLKDKPHNFVSILVPILFMSYFLVILFHGESAIILCDHIHFMIFFVIAQFYFLLTHKHGLFLIFAVLAFLTKYEAAMFTLLGLAFYHHLYNPDRKTIGALLKKYLYWTLPFILWVVLIGLLRGDLGAYIEALTVERFMRLDYFGLLDRIFPQSHLLWDDFSISGTLNFMKQFILATGILGIFIFFPQKDKTSRFLKGISMVYLALIVISRVKRFHYVSPLVILSSVIALRFLLQDRLSWIKGKKFHDAV